MRLALSLARRGLGRVWPNPAVGCVLVNDGHVAGRGWTQPGGRPHAETEALAQAGAKAKGATAYVTLEPCAHTGQTAPCAAALISAGVSRVISAMQDPDPRVQGGGHKMLRDAGVVLVTDMLAKDAAKLNLGFVSRVTKSRPMVTLKLASSLDGRIATANGDSRWITGPAARRAVHMMRATHDAVMVGSGTALADDPDLTVRGLGLSDRSPIRIVVDSTLKTQMNSRLERTADQIPVWMCHGPEADPRACSDWETAGARLVRCAADNDGAVDVADAMQKLADAGLTRVFCEGGGRLAASLIRAGQVDRLVAFSAGVAIGGDGRASLASLGLERLADAPRLRQHSVRQIGGDVMTVWEMDKDIKSVSKLT
ncbi:MAG: bifunctional diaminohydroxyphosphoribosylaminopyrimidine deaminase/5-amino-6-(5-phosphoribosylamino)uracil reductase RibD [Rhodobacteraceae bacterium]|nr:bifunctional diaminohydroxyphosphoribosylaminopyrimidine deaminase/5-amino-6-(5-phosphoribosylamino)uracil reductase RibD [Paracoccaceae bacterium]